MSKAFLSGRIAVKDEPGNSRSDTINQKTQTQMIDSLEPKISVPSSYPSYLCGDKTFKTLDSGVNLSNPPIQTKNGGTGLTSLDSNKVIVTGSNSDSPMVSRSLADSSSASSFGTSDALVTQRDVYYGTPTINGSKSYSSSSNFYPATSAGTSGYYLRSSGSSTPSWVSTPVTAVSLVNNSSGTISYNGSFAYQMMVVINFKYVFSSSISSAGYKIAYVSSSSYRPKSNSTAFVCYFDVGNAGRPHRASGGIGTDGYIEVVSSYTGYSGAFVIFIQ
jgi:hypothetical protein